MAWPKPSRTENPHVLRSDDGKYVRGISADGRALYSRDPAEAWVMNNGYAYQIRAAYQLRSYKVVPVGP